MAVMPTGPAAERRRVSAGAIARCAGFLRSAGALVGLGVVALFFVARVLRAARSRPTIRSNELLAVRKPPSGCLFGTDELGRDLLSRLIWGARASLFAGVVPGVYRARRQHAARAPLGYAGGWVDAILMR